MFWWGFLKPRFLLFHTFAIAELSDPAYPPWSQSVDLLVWPWMTYLATMSLSYDWDSWLNLTTTSEPGPCWGCGTGPWLVRPCPAGCGIVPGSGLAPAVVENSLAAMWGIVFIWYISCTQRADAEFSLLFPYVFICVLHKLVGSWCFMACLEM